MSDLAHEIASWQEIFKKSKPRHWTDWKKASDWRLKAIANRLDIDNGTIFFFDLVKATKKLSKDEIKMVNELRKDKNGYII